MSNNIKASVAGGQDKRRQALLQSMNTMGRVVLAENKYLERNKVDDIVKAALMRVLVHRPSNPFEFLANHFEWENTKCNAAKKACQVLLTPERHSSPAFENNVRQAFIIASQCRVKENLKGITGDIYMDMMQMLTPGMTAKEERHLLENVYIPAKEVVSFRAFRAGLFCAKIYEEFVARTGVLFATLEADFREEGGVSGRVAQKVVEAMAGTEDGSGNTTKLKWVAAKWKSEQVSSVDFVDAASAVFWRKMMAHCFSDH